MVLKTQRPAADLLVWEHSENEPPRISRASATFFLDWIDERMDRIRLDDPEQQEAVMRYHRSARAFREKRLASANAP